MVCPALPAGLLPENTCPSKQKTSISNRLFSQKKRQHDHRREATFAGLHQKAELVPAAQFAPWQELASATGLSELDREILDVI
jgi:hypothetical protein